MKRAGKTAVRAERLGHAALARSHAGVFGSGTDDHRHATGCAVDHGPGDEFDLVVGHRQELAGRAQRDQPVDARFDLPVDIALQR